MERCTEQSSRRGKIELESISIGPLEVGISNIRCGDHGGASRNRRRLLGVEGVYRPASAAHMNSVYYNITTATWEKRSQKKTEQNSLVRQRIRHPAQPEHARQSIHFVREVKSIDNSDYHHHISEKTVRSTRDRRPAAYHCPLFPQALMTVLYVIVTGMMPSSRIERRSLTALCH